MSILLLSFLVAILLWAKMLAEVLSHPRREKLSRCNMLMEKVNVAFSVLMITFMHGTWRMHG
jgi:hypothetical protein